MNSLLERMHSPEDLKTLDYGDLEQLSGEIRQFLVDRA